LRDHVRPEVNLMSTAGRDSHGKWRAASVARVDADRLPRATLLETLAVLLKVVGPVFAKGVIIRRPAVVAIAARLGGEQAGIRLLQRLRRKYGEGPLLLRLGIRRQALILSPGQVGRVLEQTPVPFQSDSFEKHSALAHFEPEGSLISRGKERSERRAFNEKVLQTRCPVHALYDAFLAAVGEEAETLLALARPSGALSWEAFHEGWFRLFRCVVLGRRARDDEAVTDLLNKLRGRANWAFFRPRRRKLRARFLAELESRLDRAEPGSLASLICDAESSRASSTHQAAQWLFAFDAAGIAVFRTIALLAVHPKEMAWARNDVMSRAERPELPYLRACMLDCLRLWPTTPVVLRETDAETRWDAGIMAAGTGLIIHVPFLHRDDSRIPYADSFAPETWLNGEAQQWPFIPFSAGTAECPARNLVLLLASAMLAALLERSDFRMPEGREFAPGKLPATFNQFSLDLMLAPRQR
jgi:cytochrome P450